MKFAVLKRLTCLTLLCLFAFQVNAEGLSEYLQNPEATELATNTVISDSATKISETITGNITGNNTPTTIKDSTQLKNIIELVVAGIVAAALIIVVLVTFLGKWFARRDKKLIKELRIEAEENTDHITSAATTIREQEKETTKITSSMKSQADDLSSQYEQSKKISKELVNSSEKAREHEKQVDIVSEKVSENMTKIQKYWDTQVNETVDTISLFQHKLSENMDLASEGLDKINDKKVISEELLQDVLTIHTEQSSLISNNKDISNKVASNLDQAQKESENLVTLLKKQQEQAQLSLDEYSERLHNFEEQAYEQFDTSFQVADLARQELSANLDENRKHIETMRRQEEQSHSVNNQISKNLEALDYSKIVKISETLDNTQDMFDEIHHKVEETRLMLEELKQIEEDIKKTANNVELVTKSHSILEEQNSDIDNEIDELIEAAEEALNVQNEDARNHKTVTELSNTELSNTELSEEINDFVDALDNPSENIRDNTTVAITDYKMANGDNSSPLSFFRDIQKNNSKK